MANGIQKSTSREHRWNPFEELQDLMHWDPYREYSFPRIGGEALFVPAFEVKETADKYVFKGDLPGVKEPDLDISLKGTRLTIAGKRDEETREDTDQYFTWERSYGAFSRTFTLPSDVDASKVDAQLKDGVLTIEVAKQPETQAQRIEVKSRARLEGKSTRS